MTNSPIFLKKLMLMTVGVALMMVLVTSAKADDQVVRNHSFDLQGVETVELRNSVGRIEIVPVEGDDMRITVEIESRERGFFRRQVDVDHMDIEVRERGDTLVLSFDEEHVSAKWLVEMPAVRRASVEMGVGELRLEIGATELDVDLGVGDINVYAPEKSVGRVNLDVGVGDANIRGGDVIRKESAFISRKIRAEGKGTNDLDVNLGVGDISVRLN